MIEKQGYVNSRKQSLFVFERGISIFFISNKKYRRIKELKILFYKMRIYIFVSSLTIKNERHDTASI